MRDNTDDYPAMLSFTPEDCRELRDMRILPPGCAEEEQYILLHPPRGIAGSGEFYA